MVLIIVSILFLIGAAVIAFLLFAPIRVVIDSKLRILHLGMSKYLFADVINKNNQWWVRIHAPLVTRRYPMAGLLRKPKKKPKPKNRKQKSSFELKKVFRVLKQVDIKECKLLVDTDDYILNAYLTPVFELLRYKTGMGFRINFQGNNEMRIVAQSSFFKLLRAAIF